jgi:Cu-Zn family superoxide dismutase
MNHPVPFARRRTRLLMAVAGLSIAGAAIAITQSASADHAGMRADATIVGPATATDPAPVVGFARLIEDGRGVVHVNIRTWGLPAGLHGMHIHAVGSCTPTFAAAGGHFNPTGATHGEHVRGDHPDHHAGDLPNLEVDERLRGHSNVTSAHFTLSAGATASLFDTDGSAIVIHANVDDFTAGTPETGPGNSGARIACGVIAES